jgi:hypothetical protein
MRKIVRLTVLLTFILATSSLATNSEYYFKFKINDRSELDKLTRIVSIDKVEDFTVYAYANDRQLRNLEGAGYTYEMLQHPSTLIIPEMATDKADVKAWDVYPTYDAYVSMMNQFAIDYPALCQIVDAGSSIEGRSILFAKISDNVADEEDEPEVMYTSSMHGDEITGYVSMLRLIDSLLVSYGSDSLITRLVDSCEIWINPLANPDGTYASGNHTVYGATRTNSNGVDINRNFPDPEDGLHPDGHSWQTETIVMMDFAADHSFVISGNYHGGAEVINYPWDTWARLHIDTDWWEDICHEYADSAQYYSPSGYMNGFDDGITNGYAWYSISGGRQDYMNYWHGCREVTMEISNTKLIPANQLPAHWVYLRVSFLNWLEHGLFGIRGLVTDAVTGDPVFATIRIPGHDSDLDSSRVFTDPDVGDYHRMIEAGIYDVEFSAAGYYMKTIKGVAVSALSGTRVDVTLTPLPNESDFEFVSQNAGTVDPGDDVSFNITLENTGAGNGTGINSILSTADSYITIIQPNSAFPNISALGGTGTSLSEYQFSVSSSCPLYYPVEFKLNITADGGVTDSVTFELTVGEIIEDFESGDFSSLPWAMTGSQDWGIITADPYEGSYSAKSGSVTHNQYSQMSVTLDVIEAGTISFYYRVSSESGWDYLRFYIDGVEKGEWSGEDAWNQAEYSVTTGTHTFRWRYSKDGSESDGSDCGWVDMIVFPRVMLPAPEITTVSLPDWTSGHSYSEQLEASGGIGSLTWTDKNDDLIGTGLSLSAGGLLSGTPGGAQSISFTAEVTDEAAGTDERLFTFTINPVLNITTAILPDGNIDESYSQQLAAEGGTGAMVWSDKNGDLASTGLTLSSVGLVSGTIDQPMMINFIALVEDDVGATTEKAFDMEFIRPYVCGDANRDEQVNIGDAVHLVNYVFKEGPAPDPIEAGYANGDEDLNIGDAVYIINFIFKSGGPPVCP